MRTTEKLIINAGDLGNDFFSDTIDVYYLTNFSLQFNWIGTPKGVLKVESANKEAGKNTFWHRVPESSILLTGNAGNFLLELRTCSFRKFRVVFEHELGTGQLWCEFIGKGR